MVLLSIFYSLDVTSFVLSNFFPANSFILLYRDFNGCALWLRKDFGLNISEGVFCKAFHGATLHTSRLKPSYFVGTVLSNRLLTRIGCKFAVLYASY